MTFDRADIEKMLPLQPSTFHIVMALAEDELHGYAITQLVEERTAGQLRLSAGTLYRCLHRMVEQGLVVEVARRGARLTDDERRRYYRLTGFGKAVARAEAARLVDLVRLARARGLTPQRA